jgi:hypothetical protein
MRWRKLRIVDLLVLLTGLLVACGGAGSSGTWLENFDDVEDWRLSTDAAASVDVEGGALHIRVQQPGQVAWAASERKFGDFELRVEATQVDGPVNNEYGVLIRMQGDDEFYAFSVSGDGYVRAARYAAASWSLLGSDWMPHDAVQQGSATNVLEVIAEGATFSFLVNGEQVLAVEDDALERGGIGLYAGAFDMPDVHIAFDNLTVTPAR